MLRWSILLVTHAAALAIGFAVGVYTLPILTAPAAPDAAAQNSASASALFKTKFEKGLKGSDYLHWGEGDVIIARDKIAHQGRLAPGPAYRLYLTTEFVDTKAAFLRIKGTSRAVGDVKSFNGFIVDLPSDTDVTKYTAVVIWCEAFNQFITSARYR